MFYSNECLTLFLDKPETLTNKSMALFDRSTLASREAIFTPKVFFVFLFQTNSM